MIQSYMKMAMEEAMKAKQKGDVPVGAVIVKDSKVIARGHNMRRHKNNALLHAEMHAIEKACRKLSSCFLDDCDIYVSLEPCPMCAGAILQARIKRLYFGAYDPKAGCAGSLANLFALPFSHRVEVYGGIEEDANMALLSNFFSELRKSK
ncbi:MAG: nucleoside deaminase [Clostridia bacterium]